MSHASAGQPQQAPALRGVGVESLRRNEQMSHPHKHNSILSRTLFRIALVALTASLCLPTPLPPSRSSVSAQAACGPMDVVFVVDDTGSMGPAINNVKAGLQPIINS